MTTSWSMPSGSLDRWPEDYERGRPGWPPEVVDIPELSPAATVLDLGAGTGKLTRLLVSTFARVIAVEPADAMRRLLEASCLEAEVLPGSGEDIPLEDASVDAVFAAEAFHWFHGRSALTEIARVLRPSGTLVAMWNLPAGPTEPSIAAVQQLLCERGPTKEELGVDPLDLNTTRYASGEWRLALAESSFEELQETRLPNPQTLDRDGLVSFFASMGWIADLPDEARLPLLDEVRSLLTADEYRRLWETHLYWMRLAAGRRTQLSRVYGRDTWQVYEALDESLAPSGPDSLYDLAGSYLTPGSRLLDAGCRDGAHLIELIQRYAVTGVGVDPVELHIERARAAIEGAGVSDRADVFVGVMQDLPFPDEHFDFVWCRDVVEQVDDLDAALREVCRVLSSAGRMLVYTTFATERLAPQEAEMMNRHLGNVPANLVEANVERAFGSAGFAIERKDVIGTEWREHVEERTGTVSRSLLRLSRLRRQQDELVQRFGRDIYDHVEANLHWETFQLLGKLDPTVYTLSRRG